MLRRYLLHGFGLRIGDFELGNKLRCVLGFQFVALFLLSFARFWEVNGERKAGLLLRDYRVILAILLDIDSDIIHGERGL